MSFERTIIWSEKDKEFVVTFKGFPLLSAFGTTEIEAHADADIVEKMARLSLSEYTSTGVK